MVKKLGMGGWMAIGMILGMLIFPDNTGTGIAVGIALGVAIGASQEDEDTNDKQA